MNKIKSIATKTGATLSVAAFSVLMFLNRATFAETAAEKAQGKVTTIGGNVGATDNLDSLIQKIINAVLTIIGIVAVVMIILGGVNYATSQGDPSKVKKAKDTILYGIIGLVIVIMAFAIVNFVLDSLQTA